MEAKVLQLIKVIGEEAVIFETFLQLLNRQQEALVSNDMEMLEQVTTEQEQLAVKTAAIERKRSDLVKDLSRQLNRNQSDINLTELTKIVSEPDSNQIRALQSTLLKLHSQITNIKSRNDFLIRKSMEYLSNTISHLAANGTKPVTYTPEKEKLPVRGNLLVDRRA